MITPELPNEEPLRLQAVRSLSVLDAPPQERYDRLTRLAARLFRVPVAILTLIDARRVWVVAAQGIAEREISRDESFCGHAIHEASLLEVPDAREDVRFNGNPLVVGTPWVRFYAGVVLRSPEGLALGSLCIVDQEPRELSSSEREELVALGRLAQTELLSVQTDTIDATTEISNRKGFELLLSRVLAHCRANGPKPMLMTLELCETLRDDLMSGEPQAQEAMTRFAALLKEAASEADCVGRLGVARFGVAFSRAPRWSADCVLQRLDLALAGLSELSGARYFARFSANRIEVNPHHVRDGAAMLIGA